MLLPTPLRLVRIFLIITKLDREINKILLLGTLRNFDQSLKGLMQVDTPLKAMKILLCSFFHMWLYQASDYVKAGRIRLKPQEKILFKSLGLDFLSPGSRSRLSQ